MIKKLDVLDNTVNVFNTEDFVSNVAVGMDTINKINEIIEELNHILEERESGIKVYEEVIKPVDKFAEQRKWIGKLCKFRDNPACMWKYGILKEIYEDVEFPFLDIDCYEYAECELVKPDDDIIYKGE